MLRWLRLPRSSRKQVPKSTRWDDTWVWISEGDRQLEKFAWSELDRVDAWKADLFTVDLICLGFFVRGRETAIEINEEMLGYELVLEEFQRRCAGYLADWWQRVALPAFAENHMTIWRRGAPCESPRDV